MLEGFIYETDFWIKCDECEQQKWFSVWKTEDFVDKSQSGLKICTENLKNRAYRPLWSQQSYRTWSLLHFFLSKCAISCHLMTFLWILTLKYVNDNCKRFEIEPLRPRTSKKTWNCFEFMGDKLKKEKNGREVAFFSLNWMHDGANEQTNIVNLNKHREINHSTLDWYHYTHWSHPIWLDEWNSWSEFRDYKCLFTQIHHPIHVSVRIKNWIPDWTGIFVFMHDLEACGTQLVTSTTFNIWKRKLSCFPEICVQKNWRKPHENGRWLKKVPLFLFRCSPKFIQI